MFESRRASKRLKTWSKNINKTIWLNNGFISSVRYSAVSTVQINFWETLSKKTIHLGFCEVDLIACILLLSRPSLQSRHHLQLFLFTFMDGLFKLGDIVIINSKREINTFLNSYELKPSQEHSFSSETFTSKKMLSIKNSYLISNQAESFPIQVWVNYILIIFLNKTIEAGNCQRERENKNSSYWKVYFFR